jgi:hypothetical protein
LLEDGTPLRLQADYFRLSHAGFGDIEGRNAILDAIEWWKPELDEIEADLN